MTTADFSLDNYEGALEKQPVLLVSDCKSLFDAIQKERADPSSTDERLATQSEADLRWIDARYQIADCLTKHASRKSEEVLQQVINESRRRKPCWQHDEGGIR